MRAVADAELIAVETEWRCGASLKRLVLVGEGMTVRLECPDQRKPETLMKRHPPGGHRGNDGGGMNPQEQAVSRNPDGTCPGRVGNLVAGRSGRYRWPRSSESALPRFPKVNAIPSRGARRSRCAGRYRRRPCRSPFVLRIHGGRPAQSFSSSALKGLTSGESDAQAIRNDPKAMDLYDELLSRVCGPQDRSDDENDK